MYQKDYVLRLIEQVGLLLAGILGLIKKGEYEPAREQLQNLYYEMLQKDASFFAALPEAGLTHKLLEEHNYTNGHLEILAGLFNSQAELERAEENKTECIEYSKKSLLLFEFIDSEYRIYSVDRLNKIAEIKKRIEELSNEK
jgi:hypothetical protein